MQLNELIEENTLEQISRRTRLAPEALEKVFVRDFEGFTRVQALGFISILEREYRVDLSSVREECQEYFAMHAKNPRPKTAQKARSRRPESSSEIPDINIKESASGGSIKYVIVGLLVVGLLFAAWKTYSSSMQTDGFSMERNQTTGFFSSIMNQAKSWMGNDGNASTSEQEDWGTQENVTDGNQTTEQSSTTTTSEENDIINKVKQEQSGAANTSKSNDVDVDQLQKLGDSLANANDTQIDDGMLDSEVPSISDNAVDDKEAAAQAEALKRAEEERIRAEEEAAAQKAAEEERLAEEAAAKKAAEEAAAKKAAEEAAAKKAAEEEAAKKIKIVLQPRAKIWIGTVDLLTMKRKTHMGKKSIVFQNPNGGRWLVVTGHGRFGFKIGNEPKKYNDGKKHYVLIEKGKVQDITHAQFQKLNKSKVW